MKSIVTLSHNFSTDTDTENDMESSKENQATSSTPYGQTDLSSNDSSVVSNAFHDSLAIADSISETMNAVGTSKFESGDQYLHGKFKDIALWPDKISTHELQSIVKYGPVPIEENFCYPSNPQGRKFSTFYLKKRRNGEQYKRTWLTYSKAKDVVLCFC